MGTLGGDVAPSRGRGLKRDDFVLMDGQIAILQHVTQSLGRTVSQPVLLAAEKLSHLPDGYLRMKLRPN